jgi:O-succinylbenzoate synthase
LIMGKDVSEPSELVSIFERVRGHNMAKAGVEMALWDAFAKSQGRPLHEMLGGTQERIPTGISLGIEDSVADLLKRIAASVEKGYRRIKVKIKPGWDVDVVREIRREFPNIRMMADANSAYTLEDTERLRKLDEFGLMMIEQPLGYDDIVDHAKLQRLLKTPICLDESIHSPDDGRRAIELGACGIINIKQARVGGPTQAKRLHDVCMAAKVPVWCGGLLETGIGRLHNIALATLPNFTLPGDISASERYYREDVIDPPVTLEPDGTLKAPDGPGIGHRVLPERLKAYCVGSETL